MLLHAEAMAAVSVDAELAALLSAGAAHGVVHSVFPHVINVEHASGLLFSLASSELDDAPRTVRVDRHDWIGVRAGRGARVRTGSIGLYVDGVGAIDLADAARWYTETVSASDWDTAALRSALDVIDSTTAAAGRVIDDAAVPGTIAQAMQLRLRDRRADLAAAITGRDIGAMEWATAELIGLGAGLTPAGDDHLVGLAVVASAKDSSLAHYLPVVDRVVARCAPQTTDVSAATLAEAVRGRARQRILDVLAALAAPAAGPARLRELTSRVIDIGHTSGADILSGLAAGLRLEIELRGSQ